MRRTDAVEVYQYFDLFIEEFLIKGNSILTDDKNILTSAALQNCVSNYIENYDADKGKNYDAKIVNQFKNADPATRLVFAHAEWLWCFAVRDIKIQTKKGYVLQTTGLPDETSLKSVFPAGFGSAGPWHTQNKYAEIQFNLLLIKFLKEKLAAGEINDSNEIKDWIEKICLFHKYKQVDAAFPLPDEFVESRPKKSLAMCNILLHVAFPDKYERIASNDNKGKIVNAFSGLLSEEDADKTIDEKLSVIRLEIGVLTGHPNFDFYDEDDVVRVWNYSLTEEGFSEVQGLLYKKAIILYGPPGTGKTFMAKRLAEALITTAYLSNEENIRKYFKDEENYTEGRIHRLQLHPNYNYEDFVAGVQLRKGETIPVTGKLFDICAAAQKEHAEGTPHVLILDEINRVDLSKLFGEVFSALEDRNNPIEVGVGNFKLTIPDNLYIIGTMNEIDFSLERMDFALQRRFVWFPYGFKKDLLYQIIWAKNEELDTRLKDEEVTRFVDNAQALNDEITQLSELGEQYQVGHTFFGEIVNIYDSYKEINNYYRPKYQLYREGGAAEILWEISILPILKAFLGNMEADVRRETINKLKGIYCRE